jgi:formate hydrogenlyase transcriptional activator
MNIDSDKVKRKRKGRLATADELRRQAEAQSRVDTTGLPSQQNETETQRLLHELQVHQIELEMQNAELCRVQEELELSRDKYAELYDFAPVGFFCLEPSGLIREVNLHGAQLLGVERKQLVNSPLSGFITEPDQREILANHLALVLQRRVMLKCEISLTRKDGTVICGKFQSVAFNHGKQACMILSSLYDNTARRRLEEARQVSHDQLEATVAQRTEELTRANLLLSEEIAEHKRAEEALQKSYAEIQQLKERLVDENLYLRREISREQYSEIIGQSEALSYVFFRVDQVASQNATVLLLGETGTGKGLIARAIHSRSTRSERPMITVNCTSLPANLIESELFGREKGAFTGAHAKQMGRFELANGGTIFLDEIGEMPMDLQSKLLRVIQDGEFERLGSPRTTKVDVRIIAASNRSLEDEVRAGRFRQDLFYRLNVFPITIPPLRLRKDDIPLLVNYFVAKFNKKIGKKIVSVPPEIISALQGYHWPGNVRELENVIERAVITSPGPALQVLDRFETFSKTEVQTGEDVKALAELEQDHIRQVLQITGWRIEGPKGAAVRLGLNSSTLRARMRKYGIRRQ